MHLCDERGNKVTAGVHRIMFYPESARTIPEQSGEGALGLPHNLEVDHTYEARRCRRPQDERWLRENGSHRMEAVLTRLSGRTELFPILKVSKKSRLVLHR